MNSYSWLVVIAATAGLWIRGGGRLRATASKLATIAS